MNLIFMKFFIIIANKSTYNVGCYRIINIICQKIVTILKFDQ